MNPQQPYDDSDITLVPDAERKPVDAVDELIDAYEMHDQAEKAARAAKLQIVAQLTALAPQSDTCRTVRLRGEHRRVKIEYSPDAWDQSLLRECWFSYPQFAEQAITIASFRVKLIEYKKMLHESGPDAFECFKNMLQSANKGSTGLPRITVERDL
jgi:hypothetical protein